MLLYTNFIQLRSVLYTPVLCTMSHIYKQHVVNSYLKVQSYRNGKDCKLGDITSTNLRIITTMAIGNNHSLFNYGYVCGFVCMHVCVLIYEGKNCYHYVCKLMYMCECASMYNYT